MTDEPDIIRLDPVTYDPDDDWRVEHTRTVDVHGLRIGYGDTARIAIAIDVENGIRDTVYEVAELSYQVRVIRAWPPRTEQEDAPMTRSEFVLVLVVVIASIAATLLLADIAVDMLEP